MSLPGRRLLGAGGGVLVLATLVSLVVTPRPWASLPWAVLVLVGAGVLFATLAWVRPEHVRRLGGRGSVARLVATVQLVLGFLVLLTFLFATRWPTYKMAWLSPVYAALPSVRSLPIGWLEPGIQPNQAGGVLATFVAFALALLLVPGSRARRWPAWTLAIAGGAVLLLTGSRAALAGVGVAALVLLLVRSRRWLWLVGGLAAGALSLALLLPQALTPLSNLLLRDETLDTKLVARLDIWYSALRGIQDHAMTGIGLGVFNDVMPLRYPYESVGLSYSVSQAHNLFLDVALTLGLPGLLGLLLLLGGMLFLIRQLARDPANETDLRPLAFAFLASIVVFLVFGLSDSLSLSNPAGLLLWLWAASLAVLSVPPAKT